MSSAKKGLESEREREGLAAAVASRLDDPDLSRRLADLAGLAARVCGTSQACLALADDEDVHIAAANGEGEWREDAVATLCRRAMAAEGLAVATDGPLAGFSAAWPLRLPEGGPLGGLIVSDRGVRPGLAASEVDDLATIADAAAAVLEAARRRAGPAASAPPLSVPKANASGEADQRFRLLADSLPQLIWSASPAGQAEYFNRPWCDYTGQPAKTSLGVGWMACVHAADRETVELAWRSAVLTGEDYEVRYRLRRRDGEYRWFLARAAALRTGDGDGADVSQWVGTCTDVHDEIGSAEALEQFAQELSHRIKNIFAVLNGLISLTARNNPELGPLAGELQGRVLALGRAHDFIRPVCATDDREPARNSLRGLLGEVLSSRARDAVTYAGPDFAIDDRSATPLALFFHELATNAAKYGALGNPDGRVEITVLDGEQIVVVWMESGGPEIAVPADAGFGHRLLETSIVRQLGGTLQFDWRAQGLCVIATLPRGSLCRG